MHNKEAANKNLPGGGLQRYVSKELTHFLGRHLESAEDQYQLLVKILGEGRLQPPDFPPHIPSKSKLTAIRFTFSGDPNEMVNPSMVCFCDIPVADMHIHIAKYGKFGLSFLKSFLVGKGANPVFYVAQDSATILTGTNSETSRLNAFMAMLETHGSCFRTPTELDLPGPESSNNLKDFMTRLTMLFFFYNWEIWSFMKFFDTRKQDSDKENYYMEREWRILGRLDFSIDDVHRIILPKPYVARLKHDIREYCGQLTFSDYL